jgi:hypothetical protein
LDFGIGHKTLIIIPMPNAPCPMPHLISSLDDAQEKESGRARDANAKHQRASFREATLTQKGYIQNIKNRV